MDQFDLIGSMDETSICCKSIYTIIITKTGSLNVSVKNFNKDKPGITVMLCIISDGTKIPSLIIFRGESNKSKEKKLQNNEYAKKGLCYIKYQINSWVDNSIFIF